MIYSIGTIDPMSRDPFLIQPRRRALVCHTNNDRHFNVTGIEKAPRLLYNSLRYS